MRILWCRVCTHRELSQVSTLVRVLPGQLASPAQLVVEPHEQVPDGLGARDDVERRRQRAALVKVTHPQLGAGELPLDVGVVLQDEKTAACSPSNQVFLVWKGPDSLLLWTYSDELVRVVHHGDEHVEQNHQRDDVVRPEHGRPDELRELVASLHVGDVQIQQAEYGPEERLKSLKQPAETEEEEEEEEAVEDEEEDEEESFSVNVSLQRAF